MRKIRFYYAKRVGQIGAIMCCVAPCIFGGTVNDAGDAQMKMGRPFYTGAIIPQPQEVKIKDSFVSLLDWQKGTARVCVVIGEKANKEEKTAAETIIERINRLSPDLLPAMTSMASVLSCGLSD